MLRGTLTKALLTLKSPVVVISVFGPVIVWNIFTRLYNFDSVKTALQNPVAYALLEFQAQTYVLLLGIVILAISYISKYSSILFATNDGSLRLKRLFEGSDHLFVAAATAIVIIGVVVLFLSSVTSTTDILMTYACKSQSNGMCNVISTSIGLPPNNIITWARASVACTAACVEALSIEPQQERNWKTIWSVAALYGCLYGLFFAVNTWY